MLTTVMSSSGGALDLIIDSSANILIAVHDSNGYDMIAKFNSIGAT